VISDIAFEYFYTTASLGSMSLASEKIGVAVSSISRQIAQLETSLQAKLIDRSRRTIGLTQAGTIVFEYCQGQLAGREALVNRIQDLRQLRIGAIDLAVGEVFLGRAFTRMIQEFQRAHPGMSISVTSGPTAEIIRMILNDEAHIGLIFQEPNEPKIRVRASHTQSLMAICAPDHPLAQLSEVTLEQLRAFPLCLPAKHYRIRQMLAAMEARKQVWLDAKVTTNSLHLLSETAKSGGFVSVLPMVAVATELEEGTLVARLIADSDPENSISCLIHRVGRQLDGAPARLLTVLEAHFRRWMTAPA
jgi:DNA-binding transcriptional LysR family regulator